MRAHARSYQKAECDRRMYPTIIIIIITTTLLIVPVSPEMCLLPLPLVLCDLAEKTPMHMLQSLQTVLDGNNCNNPFIQ